MTVKTNQTEVYKAISSSVKGSVIQSGAMEQS